MTISKNEFTQYVKQFKFKELFNYLGWNNDRATINAEINGHCYTLTSVVQKRSFRVLVCSPDSRGMIPSYPERLKINNKVKLSFHDHLIVFCDSAKTEQLWQLVYSQSGQTKKSEIRFNISQDTEKLYQRASGLIFNLDDEENITIIDVAELVKTNFGSNAEKVTKKFYDNFKKQHKAFLDFIKGIDDQLDEDWYASLMLNRLMFCYFIQKRGFLDGNKNYLREKLLECKEKHGSDKFYSFYRQFLLVLFHKGLGSHDRDKDLTTEIGNVPYLNGGLFDEHEIEKKYPEIVINDKAFESIFDFFDEYDWHLDTRLTASGKEINPDVLGYIFEKYINDRAQMGAYYTQEDITDYISRNCIIPYLFAETQRHYEAPFKPDGFIWQMLKDSGDSYIFDAVKKGVELQLPENIEIGVDTSKPELLERRKNWNRPANEEYALPTEIWRETVERRQRYAEILGKIQNGEITDINDLITYNLNICQFAQDVIDSIDDPDFIRHFYKALSTMTILDPTCGSGAFLFAAMNILEPLYEKCINRMDNYCRDSHGKKYKYFEDELYKVESEHHPNRQYFIYKSIILNNIYGVDIMNEAVETAKLRLFLKLVAAVDPHPSKENMGLEPLPDIDFNIKSGNTLVGYANIDEVEEALTDGSFDGMALRDKVLEECDNLAKAYAHYKEIQQDYGENFSEFGKSKEVIIRRQNKLNDILNKRLFGQYRAKKYDEWLSTHLPFHWVAEYHEIIVDKGGFDVIIGNPPYVEYSKVLKTYILLGYETISSGNIYAQVIERCKKLTSKDSFLGWIVPISSVCTDRTISLQSFVGSNYSKFVASFDIFPSKLFEGAAQRVSILLLSDKKKFNDSHVTKYNRWFQQERDSLFDKLQYINNNDFNELGWSPRVRLELELFILSKMKNDSPIILYMLKSSNDFIYVHRIINNYIKAIDFEPFFKKGDGDITHSDDFKTIYCEKINKSILLCLLNSNLFYWYWRIHGDGFHCGFNNIERFRCSIENMTKKVKNQLLNIAPILVNDLNNFSEIRIRDQKKTGRVELQTFFVSKSKHIIDDIDKILALHYGFTEEELDYIINYDIKYRMGSDTEDDE